jgi:hypothetical protein
MKKAEPILKEQLARQSKAARDLLSRMCVLRVGIDIQGLTFLRLYTREKTLQLGCSRNSLSASFGIADTIRRSLAHCSVLW